MTSNHIAIPQLAMRRLYRLHSSECLAFECEQAQTETDRMVGLTVQFYGGVKEKLAKGNEKNADGVAMYLTGGFLQSVVGSQNKREK